MLDITVGPGLGLSGFQCKTLKVPLPSASGPLPHLEVLLRGTQGLFFARFFFLLSIHRPKAARPNTRSPLYAAYAPNTRSPLYAAYAHAAVHDLHDGNVAPMTPSK